MKHGVNTWYTCTYVFICVNRKSLENITCHTHLVAWNS